MGRTQGRNENKIEFDQNPFILNNWFHPNGTLLIKTREIVEAQNKVPTEKSQQPKWTEKLANMFKKNISYISYQEFRMPQYKRIQIKGKGKVKELK